AAVIVAPPRVWGRSVPPVDSRTMRHLFTGSARRRPRGTPRAALAALLAVSLLAAPSRAQAGAAAHMAADSPRAALAQYLDFAHDGRFDEAAKSLQLPTEAPANDGPRLARRLLFVLDRFIQFDLSQVSGESEGKLDDKLPPELEEIGHITL